MSDFFARPFFTGINYWDSQNATKMWQNFDDEVIEKDLKIPHIGWNALSFAPVAYHGKKDELFKYLNEGDFVYFVHSFYGADCSDSLIAATEYGATITAAVRKNNVMGVQFHPEKSERVGLAILRAFCEM